MKAVVTNVGNNSKAIYIRGLLTGAVTGCLTIVLLLILSSFILTQTGNLPTDYLSWILLVLDGIGALAGAYIAVRIIKAGGLIWGGATGAIIFLMILIAGLMSSTDTLGIYTVIKLAVLVLAGAVGGILAVNKKDRVKYD